MKILRENKKSWRVPFNWDGDMLGYGSVDDKYFEARKPKNAWDAARNTKEFKDNYIFEDTLKIIDYFRGRSAAGFEVRSQTNKAKYIIRIKEFTNILKNYAIINGEFTGIFTFVKQGANYSLSSYSKEE